MNRKNTLRSIDWWSFHSYATSPSRASPEERKLNYGKRVCTPGSATSNGYISRTKHRRRGPPRLSNVLRSSPSFKTIPSSIGSEFAFAASRNEQRNRNRRIDRVTFSLTISKAPRPSSNRRTKNAQSTRTVDSGGRGTTATATDIGGADNTSASANSISILSSQVSVLEQRFFDARSMVRDFLFRTRPAVSLQTIASPPCPRFTFCPHARLLDTSTTVNHCCTCSGRWLNECCCSFTTRSS